MKTSLLAALGSIAMVSTFSMTALADTMLLTDHDARMGPKQEALIECVKAAHNSPSRNHGLIFSTRVTVAQGLTAGGRTYVLSGTAWDNGVRVPVTAKCVAGNFPGHAVATITRTHPDTKIAARDR